ncbi:hypothetical protein ABW19_dt0204679 [Dactylella cylindrospora]|nr:hypothetical protein ABW19_dt0204679 [Dactylella cylindrospora]
MTQQQPAGPLHTDSIPPASQPYSPSSTTTPTATAASTLIASKIALSTSSLASKPASNAYSPAALMGLAASALEQPEGSTMQAPDPSGSTKPSLTQRGGNSQGPPSLRVSTNISTINPGGLSGTPTLSGRATDSATPRSGISTMGNMGVGQSPLTAAGQLSQNKLLRPNNGVGGKRPNMRQVAPAQPEMTQAEKQMRSQKIRDIINDQFGLEIMLKHRELQDIEAELGKAEACLEQLRRCTIESEMEKDRCFDDPDAISLTYMPSQSVIDGPYSRQYADWLREGRVGNNRARPHDVLAKDQSSNFVVGRRYNRPDPQPLSKRPQREVVQQQQLQSLKKPSVCLHRQADGSIVKLTCIDCQRSDFGSAQGFINHCRLAHHREFLNHDAAAAACGSPFDITGYEGSLPPPRSNRGLKNTGAAQTAAAPKAGRKNTKKAPKVNNKNATPAIVAPSKVAPTGPLTPPLQAEDLSLAKTIQTNHLKDYLSMKKMDVENLDTMVEEAVNRVGVVDESEGDDDDGEEIGKVDIIASTTKVKETRVLAENSSRSVAMANIQTQVADNDVVMADMSESVPKAADDVNDISPDFQSALGNPASDSGFGGSEDVTEASDTSHSVLAATTLDKTDITAITEPSDIDQTISAAIMETEVHKEDVEEEQARPTSSSSRRSTMSVRSSPRANTSAPSRMSTRSHQTPAAEAHVTRHSARLAGPASKRV